MTIVQLFASPFFGGPERQMLGLSVHLPERFRSVFVSFPERGSCRAFLDQVRSRGLEAVELRHDFPHLWAAVGEIVEQLRQLRADVVCCNGYKADIIGLLAARKVGVPAVSISHGWTAANLRARLYESLDRYSLRWMDAVVGVSACQAERVRRAGVKPERIHVIRNAVDVSPFDRPDPSYRDLLNGFFKTPRRIIVGSAGRLSPEKGFENLIAAAAEVVPQRSDVGFVVFGAGVERARLEQQIAAASLQEHVVLAGFRTDVEKFLPFFDVGVLPSYTEGLPVFVLEALAARVPVVATAVGGTPEVIDEGQSGWLVSSGKPTALAAALLKVIDDRSRRQLGLRGRERIDRDFTFAVASAGYAALFDGLAGGKHVGSHACSLRSSASSAVNCGI